MFPIAFVVWAGTVAASAQVASGLVRCAGKLVRGHPVDAFVQLADGLAGPITLACQEVSRLGKDVYEAVMAPWTDEPKEATEPVASGTPKTQRRHEASELPEVSRNGMATVAMET